ncbi:hypothetical protein JTB14_016547 [Gonioctena quinquepunctata]|nr:hypothetical protein JTB14_016547 [Gonioctena quinquepunctata]
MDESGSTSDDKGDSNRTRKEADEAAKKKYVESQKLKKGNVEQSEKPSGDHLPETETPISGEKRYGDGGKHIKTGKESTERQRKQSAESDVDWRSDVDDDSVASDINYGILLMLFQMNGCLRKKPTRIVSIPKLDSSSENALKPSLFPSNQPPRQKHRRKPMSKQT